jgi:very-short-patch-repair endonuclease
MQRDFDLNAKLLAQIENWRSHLLDIGNRNPLINTSFSATRGVIEFVHPDIDVVWRELVLSGEVGTGRLVFPWKVDLVPPAEEEESDIDESGTVDTEKTSDKATKDWNPPISTCLASPELESNHIVTLLGDRALDRRARTLDGHAQLSMSEQGLHCLFIAFGFIKWFESVDSDKEIWSPLILVPASFSRDTADANWELLKAEDDVVDNACLRHRFEKDFGLKLPTLPELEQLEIDGALSTYLRDVKKAIIKNDRWDVVDRCCLGRFAFPKIAMWQDLGEHAQSIAASEICLSIGGQPSEDPRVAFGDPSTVPDAIRLDDELGPGDVKAILDCDSSQLEAIVAARKDISFVLDGPPGTGKSQTIANIIADALSVGKRVLFVSEKVAALDVVKRRLDDCGLGDFCLECHSSKANRKAVLEELKWCLEIPVEAYPDPNSKLNDLKRQREALNDYVRTLHQPQQPIGLSLYELHGNVARLTRMEMLGRSSIEFVNPETVSRTTLDGWIQLLRLATQHQSVLSDFEKHPWRGCRIKTHTLAIKSEIRNNFTLLSEQISQLALGLKPLEEAGIIPVGTKLVEIDSIIGLLQASLTIPDIPSAWFVSPRQIANALLDRHRVFKRSIELRKLLPEYVEDVAAHFSDEIIQLADERNNIWLASLKKPPSKDFEERRCSLTHYAQVLRLFESDLLQLEKSLNQLIGEINLPIRSDLSIASIGKLLTAAKLIATDAPFKSRWFFAESAKEIVANANKAVEIIEKLNSIELASEQRMRSNELLKLGCAIKDVDSLKQSWQLVRAKVPASLIGNLDEYLQKCVDERQSIGETDTDMKSLASAMHWSSEFTPAIDDALSVVKSLPKLLGIGFYNGSWADPAKRVFAKRQIASVLLDLSESQDLKKTLELRLSHRAFLPASRPLIDRGVKYASWWARLVGGFSKFRTEVSDLYKARVPETKILLDDMLLLATFHKRMGEVDSVYREMKDLLIPGLVIDQVDSWQKTLNAIDAFEAMIDAVPHVASALPRGEVAISPNVSDRLLVRLFDSLNKYAECSEGVTNDLLLTSKMRIVDALDYISNLEASTQCCIEAMRVSESKCTSFSEFERLLADIDLAKNYFTLRTEVESLFRIYVRDLPDDSNPFQPNGWMAAIRGVQSAEKLVQTFGTSTLLRQTVSTPGRLNQAALAKLIDESEFALHQVNRSWSEKVVFIDLIKPESQQFDPRKRLLAEVKECVAAAATEFEATSRRLAKLISVLRSGQAVSWDRIPGDAKAIDELRNNQNDIDRRNAILSRFNIDYSYELSDEECRVCEWIDQTRDELLNLKLAQAVATSSQQRVQVGEILAKAKLVPDKIAGPARFLAKLFDLDQIVSTGFAIKDLSLKELSESLQRFIDTTDLIDEWLQFNRWREQMHEEGFSAVVEELKAHKYAPSEAVDVVCAKFYQQLFDYLLSYLPSISNFDGVRHEQVREQYRLLDEWEIKAAAARVREFQLSRGDRPRIGWLAPITSELGILKRETEKKRRHMPLRKLFSAVPGVLQRLKPCIMMSPLSVSTFLQAETLRFDLVIFDEASQVFPWDAIGAIYRGTQLIVAGDDKQLPPTSFFSRADIESEDEDEDIGDFESILSVCKSVNMPNKRLRWHYRSRREPLIAFSNKHFYDGDLVTFPSVRDASRDAVQLIYVPDGLWSDRRNLPEARKVAELVVEHFKERPDKSLGVIAFNATQQQAIEDAIYDLRRLSPVIDALLKDGTQEPLFIKNLENVQGDERDYILLSFGYGKNEAGKFIKNFGPLSKPGGERRLNVAVTRARESITLVASVRASEMDLSGSNSVGARLLKAYLEYAEHGVDSIARTVVENQSSFESPFEEEVASALIKYGLEPVPQVGCGGFRIDLALKHPTHPGLYCLGIECDGATYHSSKTARDRDRIRQSILEGLGWRICRVWSTDWIRNPEIQIQRILSVYEQVVTLAPEVSSTNLSKPEPDFEDLQPHYVASETTLKSPAYNKIEDVPKLQVVETAMRILARVGSLDWPELISLTSRELGFLRTGKKIREKIEAILHEQVRFAHLTRKGDRISLPSSDGIK